MLTAVPILRYSVPHERGDVIRSWGAVRRGLRARPLEWNARADGSLFLGNNALNDSYASLGRGRIAANQLVNAVSIPCLVGEQDQDTTVFCPKLKKARPVQVTGRKQPESREPSVSRLRWGENKRQCRPEPTELNAPI